MVLDEESRVDSSCLFTGGHRAIDAAATALDQADFYLDTLGQRLPEGLQLALRAQLLRA